MLLTTAHSRPCDQPITMQPLVRSAPLNRRNIGRTICRGHASGALRAVRRAARSRSTADPVTSVPGSVCGLPLDLPGPADRLVFTLRPLSQSAAGPRNHGHCRRAPSLTSPTPGRRRKRRADARCAAAECHTAPPYTGATRVDHSADGASPDTQRPLALDAGRRALQPTRQQSRIGSRRVRVMHARCTIYTEFTCTRSETAAGGRWRVSLLSAPSARPPAVIGSAGGRKPVRRQAGRTRRTG